MTQCYICATIFLECKMKATKKLFRRFSHGKIATCFHHFLNRDRCVSCKPFPFIFRSVFQLNFIKFELNNVCSAEKLTKRSSNTVLRLVSFSEEQTLEDSFTTLVESPNTRYKLKPSLFPLISNPTYKLHLHQFLRTCLPY